MENHPPVYEGNAPYIFISYAHVDSPTVVPIIDRLTKWGFRVWYDAGIEAGTEWPQYIASHLENSQVVIAFISKASIESIHCRQEITFAETKRKDILAIYLDDAKLPAGMQMQLGNNQSMFYQRASSFDSFIHQLTIAEVLRPCCAQPGKLPASKMPSNTPRYTPPQPKGQKKPSVFPKVLAVALVLAVIVAGLVIFLPGLGTEPLTPEQKYQAAVELIASGNYYEAYTMLQELGSYEDSQAKLAQIKEKALVQRIASAKNGETVVWGSYEQNNNTSDGAEPIEWVVLHSEDGLTLLMSKCGLDSVSYHQEEREISWEKCDLRAWLNDEFYYEAFSSAQQAHIAKTVIATEGSENTRDKVFLLSESEAELYASLFPELKATDYAIQRGVKNINTGFWLRSPWNSYGSLKTDYANVYTFKNYVTMDKVNAEGRAVFPCILIETRDQSELERAYSEAVAIFEAGQYKRALTAFEKLGDYKDSVDYVERLPELILMKPFMDAGTGDEVTLGDHEFIVLEKQADRVLIVSKYGLVRKDYHGYTLANPSWAECTLREWLNEGFYNSDLGATAGEKGLILVTDLADDSNDEGSVQDRIFVLSQSEVLQYLPTENDRLLYQENKDGSPVMWWLRTKAADGSSRAMYVDTYGVVVTEGEYVFQLSPKQYVRPAMWIRIEQPTAGNHD